MAYTFNVSSIPATGAVAIYALISTLVAAGWVKKADSDGTTYSATGVQVTSGAAGANGLGNANAWVRLQAPGTSGGLTAGQTREITFQRGASNTGWRIKYSAVATFIGGAPAAAVTPSATDELIATGGGTDAAPTFLTGWLGTDGSYRWHIACGGSTEFYSFYAFAVNSGTTTVQSGIALDVLASGSYPATDPDPAVFYIGYAAVNQNFGYDGALSIAAGNLVNSTNPSYARAWLGATSAVGVATSGTNNQGVGLVAYPTMAGISLGTNPITNKDDLLPAWWMRPAASAAPAGLKGCSTLFQFGSVKRVSMDTADTVSAGSKDKVYCLGTGNTCIWMPWNGSSPAI